MRSRLKPEPWDLSPDLTDAPGLWRKIGSGAVYPFWRNIQPLWGGATPTNQGADITVTGDVGSGVEFTGTERIEVANSVGDVLEKAGTVAVVWTHDGNTTSGHFLDTRAGLGDGWDVFIGIAGSEGKAGCFSLSIDTGSTKGASATTAHAAGLIAGVARYDGATLYVATSDNQSASAAQTGDATRSTSPPKIGNQVNNADPLGAGRILHLMVISEQFWSDAETQQFLRDPFAIIRMRDDTPVWAFASAAAVGGATIGAFVSRTQTISGGMTL